MLTPPPPFSRQRRRHLFLNPILRQFFAWRALRKASHSFLDVWLCILNFWEDDGYRTERGSISYGRTRYTVAFDYLPHKLIQRQKTLSMFWLHWYLHNLQCGSRGWLEHLTANAEVAPVLCSIPASSDAVESEGRQMKQCCIKYILKKNQKIPLLTCNATFEFYVRHMVSFTFCSSLFLLHLSFNSN